MMAPLLTTKLYIPAPRPNLVARPKLLAQLDDGLRLGRKLSLVCAPAGFGKTTLVSAWVHQLRRDLPVAWLSLDEEDNDSQRFAVYVVAALRTLLPAPQAESFGAHFITEIHTPPHHIPDDVMAQVREQVTILLNDIAALPDKFIMVLDDYHLLNDPRIEHSMAFFLAHLPPQMHLVITSRTTPPLPLARLRARGQLTELGAEDLRFSSEETNTFIAKTMGLSLSQSHISQLETRTEGWAAGLQMAALSMHGQSDISNFIQSFAGDDRYILDYLLAEVLRHQPEAVQDFMLRTSILERMNGPLCDAVLGGNPEEQGDNGIDASSIFPPAAAQEMLERLERDNLFILPLDNKRQWYRYHHLFGELLRHRLRQQSGDEGMQSLHRRAAEWFMEAKRPAEAITHLLQAQAFERAAQLIEAQAEQMLKRNETLAMQNWLRMLPQTIFQSHPFLCLTHAWTLLAQAQFDEAAQWVDMAETLLGLHHAKTPPPDIDKSWLGHIAALRVTINSNRSDDADLIELAHQALDNLSPDDVLLRSVITESLGEAYLRRGDNLAARRTFNAAITASKDKTNIIVTLAAMGGIGLTYEYLGDLHQAAAIYREAIALGTARGSGGQPVPATGLVHNHLARCLYEWHQLDDALTHIEQGILGCKRWGHTSNLLSGYRLLATIQHARGDLTAAQAALADAETTIAASRQRAQQWERELHMDWETYHVLATQAYLLLKAGDIESAARQVAHIAQQWGAADDDALPYLLRPRLLLAQGNADAALAALNSAYRRAEASDSFFRKVEVLAAQACVFYTQGAKSQAIKTLEHALTLGKPNRYIRLFVDNGPPIDILLREAIAHDIVPEYASQILAAFDDTGTQPQGTKPTLMDHLSDRETEVLRLIAADLSNQGIADALFISVNTVKTHIKRLYGKLHVNSRVQAITRARDLDLL